MAAAEPQEAPCAVQPSPAALPSGSAAPQPFTHWLVLDFESTCEERPPPCWHQEVIELPIVVVEAATGQVVAEFREHVRPLADPRLSTFCTKLTGIQQAQVDAADPFPAVFARACAFVERVLGGPGIAQPTGSGDSHPGASSSGTGSLGPSSSSSQPGASQSGSSQPASAIFVTCGDWDLQRMLPAQAGLSQLKVPPLWQRWCNLKMPYKAWAQGALPGGAPKWVDMVEMLQGLGMPLVGRHHCGIDDARNIAAIARGLAARGVVLRQTCQWSPAQQRKLGA